MMRWDEEVPAAHHEPRSILAARSAKHDEHRLREAELALLHERSASGHGTLLGIGIMQ